MKYDNVATVEYDYLRRLEAVHQELANNYPALLERIYDKVLPMLEE